MVIGTYKNKVVLMECMIMHKNTCFKESCTLKIIIYLYQSASTVYREILACQSEILGILQIDTFKSTGILL